MKRFFKWFSIVLAVLIIIVVLVGGYLGLIPGVSKIFGSDKPRDLGVTYTEEDRLSGRAKAGWEVIELPAGLPREQSLRYSGKNAVDTTFNNAELTAWANDPWAYFPLSDCQVRVNEDATFEFSGRLNTGLLGEWAEAVGAGEEYSKVMEYAQKWYVFGSPAVYIKMSGGITNGEIVDPCIQKVEIGRLSLPTGFIEDNLDHLVTFIEWNIDRYPGFSVETLELYDGGVRFVGTLPAVVERSTE